MQRSRHRSAPPDERSLRTTGGIFLSRVCAREEAREKVFRIWLRRTMKGGCVCKEVFGIFRLIPPASACLNHPSRYNELSPQVLGFSLPTFFSPGKNEGGRRTPPSTRLFFAYFLFTGKKRGGETNSPPKYSAFLCLLSFHREKKVGRQRRLTAARASGRGGSSGCHLRSCSRVTSPEYPAASRSGKSSVTGTFPSPGRV